MTDLHGSLGAVALVLAALGAAWSVATLVLRRPPGRLYVVNLVWVVIVLALTGALGVLQLASGAGPKDGLHVLYGIVAVAALPIAAAAASGRPERQQAVIGVIGTIVALILVLRLFQTGG